MTLLQSPLPSAWLAPPKHLLPLHHLVEVEPLPIAISATLAILVTAVAIILSSRKKKGMFLEDRIVDASDNEGPIVASGHTTLRISSPITIEAPKIQYPSATRGDLMPRQPNFEQRSKLDLVPGCTNNWNSGHSRLIQSSEFARSIDHAAPLFRHRKCELDGEALSGYKGNSAYLPYPRSEVSTEIYKERRGEFGTPDCSRLSENHSIRRSPLSFSNKTRLGDAY